MTKSEASFIIHDQMPGSDLMGISYKLVNFVIDYLYDNNMEIVDRTINEDTAAREEKKIMTDTTYAEMDKAITDSMRFDNELSEGE